ncbi:MAG: holo-ACP synthase [Chlamydiae bacterium CG10_big_fil_rev_8_21_14_0_10_42_34]|nr:MAG: holo-ACP synthase [Chlamydiae bacterium CG10_big_fil_rev_8_21_14_0_10_42_34]
MTKDNNPIKGLGNDIIEIERVRKSIERHGQHFLNRLFLQKEQDYCYKYKDPVPHFAGRFSAKEAVAKALGTGFGSELSWHDIEILGDEHGKPTVHLSAAAKERFNNPHLLVSISHSASHATAVAIWIGNHGN